MVTLILRFYASCFACTFSASRSYISAQALYNLTLGDGQQCFLSHVGTPIAGRFEFHGKSHQKLNDLGVALGLNGWLNGVPGVLPILGHLQMGLSEHTSIGESSFSQLKKYHLAGIHHFQTNPKCGRNTGGKCVSYDWYPLISCVLARISWNVLNFAPSLMADIWCELFGAYSNPENWGTSATTMCEMSRTGRQTIILEVIGRCVRKIGSVSVWKTGLVNCYSYGHGH